LAAIVIKRLPRSELFMIVVGTIHLLKFQPSIGQIRIGENCRYRTHRNAGAAMDAFQRVDVQHPLLLERRFLAARMNAVDWTGVNTRGVLHAYAGSSNYVSHRQVSSSTMFKRLARVLQNARDFALLIRFDENVVRADV
jgi:hypothetical protein